MTPETILRRHRELVAKHWNYGGRRSYRVSARLMNAMYFGVPQSRERMIFIGVRENTWECVQAGR